MLQEKMDLWDEEKQRLLKLEWEAQDRYRNFVIASPDGYPTVTLPKDGVCSVKTPCCDNQSWHMGPHLHQCAFCREYYYVMEKSDG